MLFRSAFALFFASATLLFCSCKKASDSGPVVVVDSVTSKVTVTTIAGTGDIGAANGLGSMAKFENPTDVCTNSDGDILIADYGNGVIRKITTLTGLVSDFAGNAQNNQGCDNGVGEGASFTFPEGICTNDIGDVFVASNACGIRTIGTGGAVSTLYKFDLSDPIVAFPSFACADAQGNIYAISQDNGSDLHIYFIDKQGKISIFAGSGAYGYQDGDASSAEFSFLQGICIDNNNDIYVADGTLIRKITGGKVSTVAGSTQGGYIDGVGTSARFGGLTGICIDNSLNIYVTDGRIRKINPQGVVTTVAGDGNPGFKDGPAATAEFNVPRGLCIDTQGNLIVADFSNNRIRKISFNQ